MFHLIPLMTMNIVLGVVSRLDTGEVILAIHDESTTTGRPNRTVTLSQKAFAQTYAA